MKQADYDHYMNLISEGKLDEATEFRRKIMPQYIYKFYPLYSKTGRGKIDIRTFDTLGNNCIWCSKIEYFNDPYEGIGHYYGFDKDVETRLAGFLRIASFADDAAQNISMWAYYANNHKGFCVKYEVVEDRYLYDVTYIEQRKSQAKLWNDAIIKTSKGLPTEKEQLLIYEKYLTKHVSWSNEKEYRIMLATEANEKYGKLVKCESVGLKPVKIYAGLECTEQNIKRLNRISLKLGCGTVGRSSVSSSEFIMFKEK